MDYKVTFSRKTILIFAIVLVLSGVVGSCIWRSNEERRQNEEIATAEGIASVISSTFSGKTDLRVSIIAGTIDVTSINHGWIFDSKLKGTLPFSDDYFIDLSALSLDKVRFDRSSGTLLVEAPDVFITPPNINLAKGSLGDIEGWWVSRNASRDLVSRAMKLANRKATEEASKPENMEKARAEGRKRIAGLLTLPLQATGRGDLQSVRVSVRFPTDGIRGGQPWDVGPTISEVLARNRDVQK